MGEIRYVSFLASRLNTFGNFGQYASLFHSVIYLAASRSAKIEQLNKEVRILENRNEAYRQRMRAALQDLDARVSSVASSSFDTV